MLSEKGQDKMKSKEILAKIRELSNEEKKKINYEKLKEIMEYMTPDEIIELSNIIGYPVLLDYVWEYYNIKLSYYKMVQQQ